METLSAFIVDSSFRSSNKRVGFLPRISDLSFGTSRQCELTQTRCVPQSLLTLLVCKTSSGTCTTNSSSIKAPFRNAISHVTLVGSDLMSRALRATLQIGRAHVL